MNIVNWLFSNVWSIILVIFFFGGSIFVHELGHFLAARWRKLKIERFSIGFPPKLFSFKRSGVEYIIGATPLGGYVALPQLSEDCCIEGKSKDKGESLPPISYSDRVIVSAAGAFFNLLFALVLASILWVSGEPISKFSQSTQVGYVLKEITDCSEEVVKSPGFKAGLQVGDIILEVDGNRVRDWNELTFAILRGAQRTEDDQPLSVLRIKRGDEIMNIEVEPVLHGTDRLRRIGISPGAPLKVGSVIKNSPMQDAGISVGDILLSMNGERVLSIQMINDFLKKNKGVAITFEIQRDGIFLEKKITPEKVVISTDGEEAYKLGFVLDREIDVIHHNPISQVCSHFKTTLQTLGALLNRNSDIGLNKLSGPPGIAYAIHKLSTIDMRYLLGLIVLINVNLAILNLLPIPVLDGGHILFATIGKVFKPLSPKFIQVIQNVFIALLLVLMVYVMFHDTLRVGRDIKNNRTTVKNQYIEPVFE
jgi:regulator of sigma E protease